MLYGKGIVTLIKGLLVPYREYCHTSIEGGDGPLNDQQNLNNCGGKLYFQSM
jgi:hypothetical protein